MASTQAIWGAELSSVQGKLALLPPGSWLQHNLRNFILAAHSAYSRYSISGHSEEKEEGKGFWGSVEAAENNLCKLPSVSVPGSPGGLAPTEDVQSLRRSWFSPPALLDLIIKLYKR